MPAHVVRLIIDELGIGFFRPALGRLVDLVFERAHADGPPFSRHYRCPFVRSSEPGIDFTPILLVLVVAFVVLGSLQFVLAMPGAEHGLLLFEKACPIHG